MPILGGGSTVRAGTIQAWPSTAVPAGWLKCNGATVSRTLYAGLFNVIGTTYGVGDGSTTFGLPDFRGEFLRGLDDSRGIDSGRTLGSAQTDEIKSHVHAITCANDQTTSPGTSQIAFANFGGTFNSNATGGSETRPRNQAALYIIKF